MLDLKNLATFKRYLLEDIRLLVVRGSIAPVIAGMHAYNSSYKISPLPESLNSLARELLASTALAAVSLSERESWGWSLTLKGLNAGFFVGVEPEGMICLRVLEADAAKSSAMIQRQKAGLPLTQSHINPKTQSPIDVAEQYFSEVDQTKVRLAVKGDGDGVFVHSLPEGRFHAVKSLGAGELFAFIDGAVTAGRAKEVGEVLVFYECRCSEEMISRMVENMKESDRLELFGDVQQLEVECPRCGRKYTVTRTLKSIH